MDKALEILKNTELPTDAVSKVSCKKRWYSRTSNHKFNGSKALNSRSVPSMRHAVPGRPTWSVSSCIISSNASASRAKTPESRSST